MTSFWAIIKLTCRSAIRSYIFLFLLIVLILTILIMPNTVSGDGTARAYIQVSLQYSLSAISVILSLSIIWLGCFILARDIESYQLHMVVTKPVSRLKIWLGKCCGIILIHLVLLFAASTIVYGFILWQFLKREKFSEGERQRIQNEVLVGRRVYMPEFPDVNQLVKNEYRRRKNHSQKELMTESMVKDEIRKQVLSKLGEVKPGRTRYWHYKNVRTKEEAPIYLRYRTYIGKVSSKDQRETVGHWAVRVKIPEEIKKNRGGPKTDFFPISRYPTSIMCGVFHEIPLPPDIVGEKNDAMLGYRNFDQGMKPVFFQMADGPKLLVKITGFEGNYIRAIIMVSLKLLFLAGLACATGGVFSNPVAVFITVSYLMIGIFSSFLVGLDPPAATTGKMSLEDIHDFVGRSVSEVALIGIIPIYQFEVADKLADGELIEVTYISKIFAQFILLKGMPLFLLGMWLYQRRELGMVVRK